VQVLVLLDYSVSVSSSEYAKHYFDLRYYGVKADAMDGISCVPLTVHGAHKLDAMNFRNVCASPVLGLAIPVKRMGLGHKLVLLSSPSGK
jgi:hypothetical protein